MQIQDLKRWHWALAALVVGLALSYVWSNVEWAETLPSVGQPDFERGLTIKPMSNGHIGNIIVLPAMDDKGVSYNKVVCVQHRRVNRDGKAMIDVRPVAVMATSPYRSRGGDEFPSVREYLASVKQQNEDLQYRYAWYRESWAVYVLWTGASLLLIGGVWPSIVSLMTGGGLNIIPERKEKSDYDLERFGKYKEAEAKKPSAQAPSPAEMDDLHRLEQELEQKLAAEAGSGATPAAAMESDEPGEVKKLAGGPLEAAPQQTEDVEKEYGGEFYPVVRATKKKKKDGQTEE